MPPGKTAPHARKITLQILGPSLPPPPFFKLLIVTSFRGVPGTSVTSIMYRLNGIN